MNEADIIGRFDMFSSQMSKEYLRHIKDAMSQALVTKQAYFKILRDQIAALEAGIEEIYDGSYDDPDHYVTKDDIRDTMRSKIRFWELEKTRGEYSLDECNNHIDAYQKVCLAFIGHKLEVD